MIKFLQEIKTGGRYARENAPKMEEIDQDVGGKRLGVKEFSRKIGVHYSQFYRQYKAIKENSFGKKKAICVTETGRHLLVCRKAESDLFIELQPESKAFHPDKNSSIRISYREVTFELTEDFNIETFKKALLSVREAL